MGIEGAGSGDRGGGKRGSSTPLSTPLKAWCTISEIKYKEEQEEYLICI